MDLLTINLGNPREELTLPYSIKDQFDVQIASSRDEIVLEVREFPIYRNIAISEEIALVQGQISFNIQTKALIPDMDPRKLNVIDGTTLGNLDIKDNYDVYNAS